MSFIVIKFLFSIYFHFLNLDWITTEGVELHWDILDESSFQLSSKHYLFLTESYLLQKYLNYYSKYKLRLEFFKLDLTHKNNLDFSMSLFLTRKILVQDFSYKILIDKGLPITFSSEKVLQISPIFRKYEMSKKYAPDP